VIAAIDVGQLAQVVWVSMLAGVGITAAYALVVLGSARSLQARRAGDTGAAVRHAALAIVMFCLFAAAVVVGVRIMLTKS
jgi:uncharacterized membrane protein YhaH (DUF805 family)